MRGSKVGPNYFYFHCPGCNTKTSLRLLLFLLFCLIWSFAGPELFFLARESCWEPLFWWSNSLWRWHCHHDSDSESVAHQQLIHEVDLQCGDDGVEHWDQDHDILLPQDFLVIFLYIHIVVFQRTKDFYRDVVSVRMFNTSQGYMIWGPGLTVEIDESMFDSKVL